jgi:hypothetical protein
MAVSPAGKEGKDQVVVDISRGSDSSSSAHANGVLISIKVCAQSQLHPRQPTECLTCSRPSQDLTYTVKHRKTKKDLTILSHVNGFFQPGQMSALVCLNPCIMTP